MTYIILKHQKRKYHRRVIDVSLQLLAENYSTILKYCSELPRLPLTAEEILSDLIIDRMPRFVENYRQHPLGDLVKSMETDLTAVKDKEAFEYNKKTIVVQIGEEFRKSKNNRDHAHIERLQKQAARLIELKRLYDVEKHVLSYLRSCVRRTKIKYLQQKCNTKEATLTYNADPTNGLLELEQDEDKSREQMNAAVEMLETVLLDPDDVKVLMDVLVYEMSFTQIGRQLRCSNQTAARRYQDAVRNFHNLKRKREADPEFKINVATIRQMSEEINNGK